MKLKSVNPRLLFLIILLASLFIFSRLYNLDKTARFLWDESSDLVKMHQIYVEKNLTLIGPISEDGNKVFGSLTYYMLLPFAIVGNFDPLSTAVGAAFWGLLTGLAILYLSYKVNKKALFFIVPIIIFWYPLVETGRWAWNPNLIPFWATLSIIFYLKKGTFSKFLAAFFLGLCVHHHYLSVFALAGLGIATLVKYKKRVKNFLAYLSGGFVALLPFVLFDLTHPPGLFLSRILYFNYLGDESGGVALLPNLLNVFKQTFYYFTQSNILMILLILSLLSLIYFDLKEKKKALLFFSVFVIQALGVFFVKDFYTHYMLPSLPFFILYLVSQRKGKGKVFSYISLAILVVSSVFSFPKQITKVTWEGDIASTKHVSSLIEKRIKEKEMKNVNVAVLSSPDPNTHGRKYRDLLLLEGIKLKTKGEYEISDSLFVISTSSIEEVRKDPAYEIRSFSDGPLVKEWEVPDSPWKVYLLSKPI